MAIHIHNSKNKPKSHLTTKVQSIPFKIQADSDAKVEKYFDSYVSTGDDGGKV